MATLSRSAAPTRSVRARRSHRRPLRRRRGKRTAGMRARCAGWGRVVAAMTAAVIVPTLAVGQTASPPRLHAGVLPDTGMVIDGRLDEAAWGAAAVIEDFRQADPSEGTASTLRTTVRVLAGPKALTIGIVC